MKFKSLIMSLGLSSSLFIVGCNGGGSSPSSSAADQVLASSQKARSLYNQLSPKYQAMFQQQMATADFSGDNIGNLMVSSLKVWGKFSKIMDPWGEVGGLGLNFLNAVLGWNSTPNYTPYFTEIISELNQIQQGIEDTQNLVYDQSSLIISELDQQNLTQAADNLNSIENGTFWTGFKNDISGVAESQLTSESSVADVDAQLGSILKLLYNDYTPYTISRNADCLVSESDPCATVEDYNNVSRNVSAFEAYALTSQKVLYDKDTLAAADLDNYNSDLAYEYVKVTALLQEYYTITQFALAASYNPYVSNNTYGDNYYYKYLTFYDDNLEKTLSQSQALTNLYGDYLLRELNLMQQYERNIISDSVAPAGINPIKPSYIPAHNFGALGKVFQGGNWGNSCNFYVWADLDGSYLGETYTENNQFESSLLPTISLPAFSGSFVNGTTITAQCLNPVSNNMETVSNNYNNLFCTANTGPDYVLTNPNTNNQKGVLQCSSGFKIGQDFLNVDPNENWALLANQYGYSIPLNGEPHVIIQQGTTPPYALIGVQPNSQPNTISEVVGPFAWLPVNYDWYLNSEDVDGGAFGADNWFTIWQYNSPDGFKGLFKIISGVTGDPIWNDATQLSCMDSDPTCSRIVVSDARGGLDNGIGSEICLSHHLLSLGIYAFDTNYDNEFMEVHDEGGC